MNKSEKKDVKRYTKRAIIENAKGVKKDVYNFILKDNKMYSLEEVDNLYQKFYVL